MFAYLNSSSPGESCCNLLGLTERQDILGVSTSLHTADKLRWNFDLKHGLKYFDIFMRLKDTMVSASNFYTQ